MAQPISDDLAQRFAEALVLHAGNQSQAAIACGYAPGASARSQGLQLARNPRVLKLLQPIAQAQLASLTPRAIQCLAGLLTNKSGYIRLEAAKDILNRNGVGAAAEPQRGQPLIVRINLGARSQPAQPGASIDVIANPPDASLIRPGGRKSGGQEEARYPGHDFSPESISQLEPGKLGLESAEVLDLPVEEGDAELDL